jgi:hypothetical protein
MQIYPIYLVLPVTRIIGKFSLNKVRKSYTRKITEFFILSCLQLGKLCYFNQTKNTAPFRDLYCVYGRESLDIT